MNWKGDEQESHMRRRKFETQSKARGCPSLVKDRGVSLMNGHGAGGVYGARVQFQASVGNMGTSRDVNAGHQMAESMRSHEQMRGTGADQLVVAVNAN